MKILFRNNLFLFLAVIFSIMLVAFYFAWANASTGINSVYFVVFMLMLPIGIFYWIEVIKQIIKNYYYFKTMQQGIEARARVTAIHRGLKLKSGAMYYLVYAWENAKGKRIRARTSNSYLEKEAKEMLQAPEITIKVWRNHSAVINEPDYMGFSKREKSNTEQTIKKENIFENSDCSKQCEYCGKEMDSHSKQCPHCGSLHFD